MAEEATGDFLDDLGKTGLDLLREYGKSRLYPQPPAAPPPLPPPPAPYNSSPSAGAAGARNIGAMLLDIMQSPIVWLVVVAIVGGVFFIKVRR